MVSFDNIAQDKLIQMIEKRIADPRILRLIQKWLKAGVMENGDWSATETGTPQSAVMEAEADVVRLVFQTYIEQAASINAITRMLNERQIPTRKGIARWERSTVWAMLRNPAYVGRACFGKTELRRCSAMCICTMCSTSGQTSGGKRREAT